MSQTEDEQSRRAEQWLRVGAGLPWSPQEIAQRIGEHVVGQTDAVRATAIAVHHHLLRVRQAVRQPHAVRPIAVPSMLLIGPTGVGKTSIARALGSILPLPVLVCDASHLTEEGYVGSSVADWLRTLLHLSEGLLPVASRSILFIDEVDKKAASGYGPRSFRDVSGDGAQNMLLRLLEGGVMPVEILRAADGAMSRQTIAFDVSNLLIITAGAFVGLSGIIRQRMAGPRRVGFSDRGGEVASDADEGQLLRSVEAADLIDFGMKPELIGRLGRLVVLSPLGRAEALRILCDVPNGPVKTAQAIAGEQHFRWDFSRALLLEIVDRAMASGLGARAMHGLLWQATERAWMEVPEALGRPEDRSDAVVTVHLNLAALQDGTYEIEWPKKTRAKRPSSEPREHLTDSAIEMPGDAEAAGG